MQKKLFLCFLVLLIAGMSNGVIAKTVEVLALSEFSTANPSSEIQVRLLDQLELPNNLKIESGSVLSGRISNVKGPRRLKRNAKFSFKLERYTDKNGNNHIVSNNIIASYASGLNGAKVAKSAALGVGNYFVKGLSMGVAAVEGAIENNEGNRLKSSAKSMYESSFVSYIEKGEDLLIEQDSIFYLKFPNSTKSSKYNKTEKE